MPVEELADGLEQINNRLDELMAAFWAMYDHMTFENVAWARADDACIRIAQRFVGHWV